MILPLHIEISDRLRICESRLAASIDADDLTLSVTAGDGAARFPSYAPFLALIESEIVKVTDVSTDTFTIERGARDTTAASHTSGTPIRAIIYSDDVVTEQLIDDEPVNGATTAAISSNWAYDYVKEQEEKDALRDLETQYDNLMTNERHASNRRGYEIR